MADVKVRIEVNPNAETETLGDIVNQQTELANTSFKVDSKNIFQSVPKSKFNGNNGLSFARDLCFNGGDYLANFDDVTSDAEILNGDGLVEDEQNPLEFIWGVVPITKEYHVELEFTNAQNLKDIIVYGDTVANQFPTRAIVDGNTEIFSDDATWAINLGSEASTHTIEFTHWNRADYNACLTRIMVTMQYLDIDRYNGLKSVESLSQSTGQADTISYGTIASSGSVDIIDVRGEIADMIKDGIIPKSNINVDVIANGKMVQKHISYDSNYEQQRLFNISLSNESENFANLQFYGRKLTENENAYTLLTYILTSLGYNESDIEEMTSGNMLYRHTNEIQISEYLKNIEIPYAFLYKSNYQEVINKICELAQINLYKDDNGKLRFITARPNLLSTDRIIAIPTNNQMSSLEYNAITKNNIKSCFVPTMKIESGYKNLVTKEFTQYKFDEYSRVYSEYTNIINAKTFNQDIEVIANHLESANGNWFYSIAKFNVKAPEEEIEPSKLEFRFTDGWTYYIPDQGTEEFVTFNDKYTNAVNIYNYSATDEDIVGEWANYVNGQPSTIKVGTGNSDVSVRINTDKTFTIYVKFLTDVLVGGRIVAGLYNIHNYNIEYKSYTATTSETEDKSYDIELPSNELIQTTTRAFENRNISDIIVDNIVTDYADGIKTARISVSASNYYDINNELAIDWSNGEIFQVGDVVCIFNNKGEYSLTYENNEPVYFRVTGRNFRKSGVPLIDLELQECKKVVFEHSFETDSWSDIVRFADNGLYKQYYAIGDKRTERLLNGNEVTYRILDFEYDNLHYGSGKAPMSIAMDNFPTSELYSMLLTEDEESIFENSNIRKNILPLMSTFMSPVVTNRIKFVDKLSRGIVNYITTSERFWIYSENEITGPSRYRYWKDIKNSDIKENLIKYMQNGKGEATSYWLRDRSGSKYFSGVSGDGVITAYSSNRENAICVCFCI